MIRINLLPGQQRPKAKRGAAAVGAPGGGMAVIFIVLGVLVGLGAVAGLYVVRGQELTAVRAERDRLKTEKDNLEKVKAEVEEYQRQKQILDQRIAVIQELQRNRQGGQELLDVVATTVNKVDTLWLTNLERKGNTLNLEGMAASISAVANMVTQLKRAGYFDKVEIKETRQDDRQKAVQVFQFNITADFVLPGTKAPGAAAPGATQKKV